LNVNAVAFAVAVGVPLITPVDAFNVRPPGKVPEVSVHAYGVVPPLATNVCEYGVPTWPFTSEVVVTLMGFILGVVMVMLSNFVAALTVDVAEVARAVGALELPTCTVNVEDPEEVGVGVPDRRPVDELKLNPAGKDPVLMDQL
jgi:hypothetical protein